jgi:quinohemoprotein ethanol dehydrogenase
MRLRTALRLTACLGALSLMGAAPATVDWPNHGGPVDESGFAGLDQINRGDVSRLGLAWSLDLPGEVSLEATPLAVGGVLYFTGSYAKVYAVDGATGKTLWTYDPQVWKRSPGRFRIMFSANRGVAYADGRVFVAALDGVVTALDAKTGKVLWEAPTLPENPGYYSTGAPLVFRGKVLIGNAGGDAGMRGFVSAFDQATGKLAWRFYLAPGSPEENKGDPTMEMAAKTWTGEWWKTGTGGGPWNGLTYDPELNQVYIGTGNSGPYDPRVRSPGGGDNLFLTSIVAVDADTGKYKWHYQANPREAWDYKATANMIETTLTIGGRPRKVLMQAPTNGFFYVLDRETGKLISAEKLGKVTWADHIDLATGRPVENPNVRYETGETIMWPGPAGAHNWNDMSFSPKSGLVYIPYTQYAGRFATKPRPGELMLGGLTISGYKADDEDGWAALQAWDPVTQKQRWMVRLPNLLNGGTLATAGDLVFQGTTDGFFSAYDAETGAQLWRFNAGLGIVSAPISYAVDGRQYVSILVGFGGGAGAGGVNIGWKFGAQTRRLLTFALDGKATLSAEPGPDLKVRALDDPSLKLDPDLVERGRRLSYHCLVCHGPSFRSSGAPGPDLRESQLALSREGFEAVVRGGALQAQGMPKFDNLSAADADALFAYLRDQARKALTDPHPEARVPGPGQGEAGVPGAHL